MPELVKGAIAEAEAYGKQADGGSADMPAKIQLGRDAQASLQVRPQISFSPHDCLPVLPAPAAPCVCATAAIVPRVHVAMQPRCSCTTDHLKLPELMASSRLSKAVCSEGWT